MNVIYETQHHASDSTFYIPSSHQQWHAWMDISARLSASHFGPGRASHIYIPRSAEAAFCEFICHTFSPGHIINTSDRAERRWATGLRVRDLTIVWDSMHFGIGIEDAPTHLTTPCLAANRFQVEDHMAGNTPQGHRAGSLTTDLPGIFSETTSITNSGPQLDLDVLELLIMGVLEPFNSLPNTEETRNEIRRQVMRTVREFHGSLES